MSKESANDASEPSAEAMSVGGGDQSISPLEPLDPQRLRAMVVTSQARQVGQQSPIEQDFLSPTTQQPIASARLESAPGSNGSSHSVNPTVYNRRGGTSNFGGSPHPSQSPFQQQQGSMARTTPTLTSGHSPYPMPPMSSPQQLAQFPAAYQVPSNTDASPQQTVYFTHPQTPTYVGMAPTSQRPLPSTFAAYPSNLGQMPWAGMQQSSPYLPAGGPQPPQARLIIHPQSPQIGRVPYPGQGYPIPLQTAQGGYTAQVVPPPATKPQTSTKGQRGKRQTKKGAAEAGQQPQQQQPPPPQLQQSIPQGASGYSQPSSYQLQTQQPAQSHPAATWGTGGYPMQFYHPQQQQQAFQGVSQPLPYQMPAQQYGTVGALQIPSQRYPPPAPPQQRQAQAYLGLVSPTPGSTQSPGTADNMRSPQIISPNRVGQLPQMPQPQHQPLQPPPPQQMVPGRIPNYAPHYPVFYGHEPGQAASRCSPDLCLAGCVFLLLEEPYSPQLNFQMDRSTLPAVIRFYGGDVEQPTPRGIPDRVTHVLCTSIFPQEANKPLIHQALSDRRKRIVTYQWLNETIMKKRVDAPTKACHLPTCYGESNRPATDKVVVAVGFDALETINVKYMIAASGGSYSGDLTEHTNIMVVNQGTDVNQIRKAKEQGIWIVNYQWLMEVYLGNTGAWADWENPIFSLNNMNSMLAYVSVPTYILERVSPRCQKLLAPWKIPIPFDDNILGLAVQLRTLATNDMSVFPHLQFKCINDAPSEEQISRARELMGLAAADMPNAVDRPDLPATSPSGSHSHHVPKEPVRVHFDGLLLQQIQNLSAKLRFLGGEVVDTTQACTHLVVPNLERNLKLLDALAAGKEVISPQWIQQSYSLLRLIDCFDFYVNDPENERKYSFSLKNTILRARRRQVFQDTTFHLSENVRPSFEILSRLIKGAGGRVSRERPTKKHLAHCIELDTTYFLVVSRDDLHLYRYLTACNFPMFNEELVLMSILRGKIEATQHYRVLLPPQTTLTAGYTTNRGCSEPIIEGKALQCTEVETS